MAMKDPGRGAGVCGGRGMRDGDYGKMPRIW